MSITALARLASLLVLVAVLAGCATTTSSAQRAEGIENMPEPERVLVYDFAATPADLPADSPIQELYQPRTEPQSEQQIALGRRLGEELADQLAHDLRTSGISAIAVGGSTVPVPGDGIVRGEFVSVVEGDRYQRMLIGFGAGASNLQTLVETYFMTEDGLVPAGAGQVTAGGGMMPGILIPVGIGAGLGSVAVSAAVSGSANILQEAGPESITAAADRSAKEIAARIVSYYRERGWL